MTVSSDENNQCRIPENMSPHFRVEHSEDEFRVNVGNICFGEFADTASNRKAVLPFLREMRDGTDGRRILTDEQLAEVVGSSNRQAADNHLKGFRDAGGDMSDYLRQKYKVDDAVTDAVWKAFRENPYTTLKDLTARANKIPMGGKTLSEANVRTALGQISGYKVWRELLKGMEKGKAHYKEGFLLRHLLGLLSGQDGLAEQAPVLPADAESQISEGTEPAGRKLPELKDIPEAIKKQAESLFCEVKDAPALDRQLSDAWEGQAGLLLLAFVLYTSGLSYATIGGWFGVNASTVCRWLLPFAAWGWEWLQMRQVSFSGRVAVDEKEIKIGGETWYLFVAADCVTRFPLHIAIYPSNGGNYCLTFLLELKNKGYVPFVIITDGWDAYINAIATAFPDAVHMLCRFHLIRSVFRRMRKIKLFNSEICEKTGNLFKTDYKRTVVRRVEKLKEKLEKIGKVWVLGGLLAKLPQVLPAVGSSKWPSTSNAAEWFFGAFDRFYRLKGPFCDEKSAYKQIGLFALAYVFRLGLKGQASPLERANTDVSGIPFYHLINRPNVLKLKELTADQYKEEQAADHYKKAAGC
jgi:transposase-like protein